MFHERFQSNYNRRIQPSVLCLLLSQNTLRSYLHFSEMEGAEQGGFFKNDDEILWQSCRKMT